MQNDDFAALQASLLQTLSSNGGAMSTGRLGYELGARKKPVAAALFRLLEQGAVRRIDGVPPKWEAVLDFASPSSVIVGQEAGRFAYEAKESPNPGGPRPRFGDFEVLRRLVCQTLARQAGATAGALGHQLGACRKAINAALYACEKDGTAWTVGEKAAGERLRWQASPELAAEAPESLPAAYAYSAAAKGLVQQGHSFASPEAGPPTKRAKTEQVLVGVVGTAEGSRTGRGESFELLKLLLRGRLELHGEAGATSGALGYELAAVKKAVSAALYSCEHEGVISRITADGVKPRWVSVLPPPDLATNLQLPAEFTYAYALGADEEDSPTEDQAAKPRFPPLPPRRAPAVSAANSGVSRAPTRPPAAAPASCPAASNPVSLLNEWGQKNRHAIVFNDLGAQQGLFLCQVSVDGQALPAASASNKKEASDWMRRARKRGAKRLAAAAAVGQLGLA
ncbi:unnamed protein product [Polarella glacialis]|uniref:Uncharacterized protein n=1 Tax=Polarella glacialis TaxID=89957 RepID=A0A813ENZ1_POLGL|nr:unnamed protein product [Polarella glacialis]